MLSRRAQESRNIVSGLSIGLNEDIMGCEDTNCLYFSMSALCFQGEQRSSETMFRNSRLA